MSFLVIIAIALAALMLRTRMLARRSERLLPPAGQMQPVTGGTIHYVEAGDSGAQSVVLIHGLAGNLQHFTYGMVAPLAQDHHVIAPDRPGCGYSLRDHDDLAHLEDQARMLWEFLDARGVSRPVLVGHSLGGAVALAMALQRPEAPLALALLCPATQPQSATPDVFRPLELNTAWLRRAMAHTVVVPLTRLIQPRVLRKIFSPEPVVPEFKIRGGGLLALRPETFISASADLMGTRRDVSALVARFDTDLRAPGAILYGESDPILSPAHHGASMAQYGYTMETLPGRGHMIPMTAPEDCVAFIKRVIADAGQRDQA